MARIDLEGPWRAIVRAPMLRLATPFMLGIAIGGWTFPPTLPLVIAFIVFSIVVGLLLLARSNREKQWQQGLALMCWFLCFGMLWHELRDPRTSPDHVERISDREGPWLMRVVAINGSSSRTVRADVEVEHQLRAGSALARKGSVMITLLQDEEGRPVKVGDQLWVDVPLTPVARVPDPGGFDKGRWAASRGITLEAFAPGDRWSSVGHRGHWTDPFTNARKAVSEWLNGSELPLRERALVKALVLGQRDELENEQRTSFARSGTIHVLAVSGMHVGLIFAILTFVFGWWGSSDRARVLRGIVILFALWGYAGLTGGAPSVLRATIMFSLFTLANMSAQRTDHLNSLFAAALVLLVWDPNMMWSIGFQLSFLAVLGIILFYGPVEGLWSPKSKVLRTIWSLGVVSISAQMLTTPVSLYLFKAFPVWFLPANIVVVSAVGLAVNGAVALVFLYKVPYLGAALTWCMTWLLKGVGMITDFFAGLPGAYPDIRVGAWDVLFLYLCILAFVAWWQWRWRSMRWVTLLSICALLSAWAVKATEAGTKSTFVVYDVRDGLLASQVQGRTLVSMDVGGGLSQDTWALGKVKDHCRAAGITQSDVVQGQQLFGSKVTPAGPTMLGAGVWHSLDHAIGFHTGASPLLLPTAVELDAIVLHDLQELSEAEIDRFKGMTDRMVLSATVHWRVKRMLEKTADTHGLQIHDVKRMGAFILGN